MFGFDDCTLWNELKWCRSKHFLITLRQHFTRHSHKTEVKISKMKWNTNGHWGTSLLSIIIFWERREKPISSGTPLLSIALSSPLLDWALLSDRSSTISSLSDLPLISWSNSFLDWSFPLSSWPLSVSVFFVIQLYFISREGKFFPIFLCYLWISCNYCNLWVNGGGICHFGGCLAMSWYVSA